MNGDAPTIRSISNERIAPGFCVSATAALVGAATVALRAARAGGRVALPGVGVARVDASDRADMLAAAEQHHQITLLGLRPIGRPAAKRAFRRLGVVLDRRNGRQPRV